MKEYNVILKDKQKINLHTIVKIKNFIQGYRMEDNKTIKIPCSNISYIECI